LYKNCGLLEVPTRVLLLFYLAGNASFVFRAFFYACTLLISQELYYFNRMLRRQPKCGTAILAVFYFFFHGLEARATLNCCIKNMRLKFVYSLSNRTLAIVRPILFSMDGLNSESLYYNPSTSCFFCSFIVVERCNSCIFKLLPFVLKLEFLVI
jgi:hypothetical protein